MKKKILAVMMMLILTGTLAACGKDAGKTENQQDVGAEETTEEASATDEAATGELAYLKDFNAEDYVTLGEYKGVSVNLTEPVITDEYLEGYIEYLLQNSPVSTPVTDRTIVETGDTANIDYVGKVDNVAFENGSAEGADLTIGSGQFIPGFEDGVIGMKVGETKDIDVTFPDPYTTNPEMSGKEAVFTVTVNSISTQEIPELTDEYVTSLGMEDCSTVEEYRNLVKEALTMQEQQTFEQNKQNMVMTAVEGNSTFKDAPEGMITRMNDTLTSNITSYAQMYGVEVGEYVANAYGGTADTYQDVLREQSALMAKRYIMLAAIAQKEGLTVSDEEAETQIAEEATSYGYATVDEYKTNIDFEAYKEYMMTQKVMQFLAEQAVVEPLADVDTTEAPETTGTDAAATEETPEATEVTE